MHVIKTSLDFPGDVIAFTWDRTTVELQWVRTGAYTVTVTRVGTHRIEELCGAFTTEPAARAEARRVATALFAGHTVAQIIADKPANLVVAEVERIVNTAARTLTDTVPAAGPANALCHASGVRPTSDHMDRIILAATMNGGVIDRSREATSTQLIALKKRNLVNLTYTKVGRTRTLTGAALTVPGWAYAARLHKQAVTS